MGFGTTGLQQLHFYKYRLHYRRRERSLTFYDGWLFSAMVNVFAACKESRLSWLRTHQNCIRADAYLLWPDEFQNRCESSESLLSKDVK